MSTYFANLTKKIGIILVHSHWTAIVSVVVKFLFDTKEKDVSVPD